MARQKSKVVNIPSGSTKEQVEQGLDNLLNQGWDLVGIYQVGNNVFAVLVKRYAN